MYLIAEIGNNHDGLFEKARRLIKLAADSGADAVKFQIFKAEKLIHPSVPSRVNGHKTQLERLKSLEFSDSQWDILYYEAKENGVDFLATCFDLETLDKWAKRLKKIKISSGDLTYHAMLRQAVTYGKPIYLSTGCAQPHEIELATQWIPSDLLTIMHCVSSYPCLKPSLSRLRQLQERYHRVGYSCHTPGIEACYVAACMGVQVIEKHFTDETRDYGDHQHSATPLEFRELKRRINVLNDLMKIETKPIDFTLRRGAYAARSLLSGETISKDDVICLRPDFGDSTDIVGRKLRKSYQAMEAIDG